MSGAEHLLHTVLAANPADHATQRLLAAVWSPEQPHNDVGWSLLRAPDLAPEAARMIVASGSAADRERFFVQAEITSTYCELAVAETNPAARDHALHRPDLPEQTLRAMCADMRELEALALLLRNPDDTPVDLLVEALRFLSGPQAPLPAEEQSDVIEQLTGSDLLADIAVQDPSLPAVWWLAAAAAPKWSETERLAIVEAAVRRARQEQREVRDQHVLIDEIADKVYRLDEDAEQVFEDCHRWFCGCQKVLEYQSRMDMVRLGVLLSRALPYKALPLRSLAAHAPAEMWQDPDSLRGLLSATQADQAVLDALAEKGVDLSDEALLALLVDALAGLELPTWAKNRPAVFAAWFVCRYSVGLDLEEELGDTELSPEDLAPHLLTVSRLPGASDEGLAELLRDVPVTAEQLAQMPAAILCGALKHLPKEARPALGAELAKVLAPALAGLADESPVTLVAVLQAGIDGDLSLGDAVHAVCGATR